MELNETPIRTSRNFNINNINLDDVEFPNQKAKFENIEIASASAKITSGVKMEKLTYGNGKIVEENILNFANNILKIEEIQPNETVEINYNFDDENLNLINYMEIDVKKQLNIVIKYNSKTSERCLHNGIIKVFGKENSKANITIINLLNENSNNLESIENELENSSNMQYTIIDLGAKNSIINYFSNVIGENAQNNVKTIYLGDGKQLKDLNYIVHLKGKKSKTDIDVQGALNDEAKKHFKGTIDFKKGCKKAKGNENEYCMILSDKAKTIALPILLCTEDDVEGNHSSASGKADKNELFYIMTRGISYKEAIKLMVKARFYAILETVQNEKLKEEISEKIDKKLSYKLLEDNYNFGVAKLYLKLKLIQCQNLILL